jgi:putative ABC transport system ATP-binding protein
VIRLQDIEVTYGAGTDAPIRALCIPSLHIAPGCWCNVIGPNGSGKTTLLRILSGGGGAFRGDVFVQGINVTKWKARRLYGCVQLVEQSPDRNTVPSMTVEENLRLYSQPGGIPSLSFLGSGSVGRIRHLLARFEMGLEDRLSSQVGLLSGGQKQAVALAAVLLRSPKVLLLDEFLASIDPKASPKLLSIVREAASEQGITVLMVSHDLQHVESAGDRLIILSNGKIADDLSTADHRLQRSDIVSRYSAILERNGIL